MARSPTHVFRYGGEQRSVRQARNDLGFVSRLKGLTDMKIVIKGIVTAEDAASAVNHGLNALIVSNHGGRAEASG